MRRYYIILMLCSVIFVCCGPSERALRITKLSGEETNGKPLYNDLCSRCHGLDGRGGKGVNLIKHRSHHDDAELIDSVIEGGEGMPSFRSLEDQELADIVRYIRTL